MARPDWSPATDIIEEDNSYVIALELPEIKKDDIKVTVEDGVLSISGERKFENEETNRRYHRVERAYGSFMRSFTLPENSDGGKVDAEFKDGMLKVSIGKREIDKPKPLEVKVR